MNETRVLSCACESAYQDKKYGNKKRLVIMKQRTKGHPPNDWTCTVCGKVQRV
jgi:hypothetical protein